MAAGSANGPTVVFVGRPNVGKSTLFNRVTNTRRAIVAPIAGTTRDVMSQPAEWNGVAFRVIDTGGMFGASEDPLHELVVRHGRRALESADLVVLVVDGRQGLVPGDEEIARAIHASNVPAVVAINKTDDRKARDQVGEFYRLGVEPVFEVAAEHGTGVGDLLDEVVARIGGKPQREEAADAPLDETSIAIVGRPNVGKSSLVNRLLREDRMLVSDMPGTTRDAVDSLVKWHHRTFRIVDTAGMRRPGKVARGGQIEAVSVLVARRALARADVAVLVVDAVEGATDQDGAIAGEAERTGCGVIIAVNKWDLMKEKGQDYSRVFDDELRQQLKFLHYAPLVHISARTGERTPKLLEVVDKVAAARLHRVSTGELNRWVQQVTAEHPPASPGRREVRVLYVAQTGVAPPSFVFFTNGATSFHFSYERFLENRLRESFGFLGTPIRLQVRRRRS